MLLHFLVCILVEIDSRFGFVCLVLLVVNTSARNDLLCVERDVKLYSLTHEDY